ncbi:MAG: cation-translocating P-type ATPase C-terminal domain-containing protein, partial [Dehalococcoidia bacterium]
DEPVLTRPIAVVLAVRGIAEGAGALAVFVIWLYVFGASDDAARTVAFAAIVVAELLEAHGSRSLYRTILDIGPLSNPYVVVATIISFGGLLAVLYVPPLQDAFHTTTLGLREWIAVAGVGVGRLLLIEGMKVSPWRLRPA